MMTSTAATDHHHHVETDHHHHVTTSPVVLDIGGDIGAAIVTASHVLEGHEIEIRPAGHEWDGRHVAFHLRATANGHVVAAVFPDLSEGDWEVRLRAVEDRRTVSLHVEGGRVTTVQFPPFARET
jgi:hypothetical protein